MERKLNVDIGGSVSQFQAILNSFEIKTKLQQRILKGRGLEFDGYRVYSSEDDSSTIDWKASKRANQILVKKYIEEQNLKVFFIIDVGENMVFGSSEKLKCEYSAEVAAALSSLIMDSGNKMGYFLFGDKIKEFVKPGRGAKHFGRFVSTLTDASIYGGHSSLEDAIDFALNYLSKAIHSVVIISDFLGINKNLNKRLNLISQKFETMAVMIRDPLDRSLPNVSGELVMEDPLSGQRLLVNPQLAKKSYEIYAKEQEDLVKQMFRDNQIDLIELITNEPFAVNLAVFIKERVKMAGKIV